MPTRILLISKQMKPGNISTSCDKEVAMKLKRCNRLTKRRRQRARKSAKRGISQRELSMLGVVAEYRGVALVERFVYGGVNRKGKNHQTGGRICVLRHAVRLGVAEFVELQTEANAKAFLDKQSPDKLNDFYSLRQLAELLGVDDKTWHALRQVRWRWDEEQQTFVETEERIEVTADLGIGKTLRLRHPASS